MYTPNPPLDSEERKRLTQLMRLLGWTRKPRGVDFFIPETGFLEIGCRATNKFATLMTPDPFEFRSLVYQLTHARENDPMANGRSGPAR